MTHTRMTDTQWLRIRSCLDTCSDIRVGKDMHGRPSRERGTPLGGRVQQRGGRAPKGGPRHDSTQAQAWVEDGTGAPLPCLIADRAYDSDGFRAWWAQQGLEAVLICYASTWGIRTVV